MKQQSLDPPLSNPIEFLRCSLGDGEFYDAEINIMESWGDRLVDGAVRTHPNLLDSLELNNRRKKIL